MKRNPEVLETLRSALVKSIERRAYLSKKGIETPLVSNELYKILSFDETKNLNVRINGAGQIQVFIFEDEELEDSMIDVCINPTEMESLFRDLLKLKAAYVDYLKVEKIEKVEILLNDYKTRFESLLVIPSL